MSERKGFDYHRDMQREVDRVNAMEEGPNKDWARRLLRLMDRLVCPMSDVEGG